MADDRPTETFDATDVAAIDNQNREAAKRVREDADVLRLVMHSKQGRAWMYRFLEACHIFSTSFAGEETHISAFQQGEENVGKKLMSRVIDASPDLYMKMIKEQREEEQRLNEVRRTERKNREATDSPAAVETLINDLPPPAGWPGGPKTPPQSNGGKKRGKQ